MLTVAYSDSITPIYYREKSYMETKIPYHKYSIMQRYQNVTCLMSKRSTVRCLDHLTTHVVFSKQFVVN